MSVSPPCRPSLEVLIVAGYFPPHAPLAATRAPALARFLRARGHGVRVLAARNAEFPAVADHGLPPETVTWAEVAPPLSARALARLDASSWRAFARPADAARRLLGWPDHQSGWLSDAVSQGRRLISEARPDVILATVPPHTGLLVAEALHKASGVPWVAEFRDLWVEHPYYDARGARKWLDTVTQRRVLSSAAGLVTVTDGWRRTLAARWPNKPVRLARNGFDDAEVSAPLPEKADGMTDTDTLNIIYAGVLYGDKRDPRPLFAALARLDVVERARVRVHFYGSERATVEAMATEHALSPPTVTVHDPVPRDELLALQRRADLLLLLRWNDPREDHVLAGKLFEYIGCRRPILSVGSTTGEAADIIRNGDLGVVSNDPDELTEHIRRRLHEKNTGGIPPLPETAVKPHARTTQFETVEALMADVAGASSHVTNTADAGDSAPRTTTAAPPPRSA